MTGQCDRCGRRHPDTEAGRRARDRCDERSDLEPVDARPRDDFDEFLEEVTHDPS